MTFDLGAVIKGSMQSLCCPRTHFVVVVVVVVVVRSGGGFMLVIVVFKLLILYETGWQPRRTIMFAHWDAGDLGQLGSYEWVEVFICGSLTFVHVVVYSIRCADSREMLSNIC